MDFKHERCQAEQNMFVGLGSQQWSLLRLGRQTMGLWVGLCSRVLGGSRMRIPRFNLRNSGRSVQTSQASWLTATIMAFHSEPSGVSPPLAGVLIAVISSFINGSTFVLQKKGILRSRDRGRLRQSQRGILTEAIEWVAAQTNLSPASSSRRLVPQGCGVVERHGVQWVQRHLSSLSIYTVQLSSASLFARELSKCCDTDLLSTHSDYWSDWELPGL